MNILVTGGAGFIGSHLVDALVKKGHFVRVLDNLDPQVHGLLSKKPQHLNKEAQFIKADVCDYALLNKALKDIEVVFHLASRVGIGQSMYEIRRYTEINTLGTANLLDILTGGKHKIKKLIVASSMSIYGEGKYGCKKCGPVYPQLRKERQLKDKIWEMVCPACGRKNLKPLPTDELKPLFPTSIYAINKRDQEEMCLVIGRAYKIPVVALRYFNVYGPRQALSNPYTGVAAIFSSRLLNNRPPLIFEDGLQSRDFIHVSDIVAANILVMERKDADYRVFNVGTGRPVSVLEVAEVLIKKLNPRIKPEIANRFREGDIRHCYADTTLIKKTLDFKPKIKFEDGMAGLIDWVKSQKADDLLDKMQQELKEKGLIRC